MAPRIYISLRNLERAELLKPGSLAWRSVLYKTPELSDAELDVLRDRLFKDLPTSDIQVFTHRNSSEQMNRLLNYLNDFLGLVSLAALFIACIGLTFLLSTYLQHKSKSMAILIALGLSRWKAMSYYTAQLSVLVVTGALLSLVLATIALPLIMQASQSLASFPIRLSIEWRALMTALALGIAGGLSLLLPHMVRLYRVHPHQLLRGGEPASERRMYWMQWMAFLPALVLFFILSVRQMNSVRNGGIFFLSFVGAGLVLYAVSYWALPWVHRPPRPKWLPRARAMRDLPRLRTATVTGFLAPGVFLVNIVPQIKANSKTAHLAHSELFSTFKTNRSGSSLHF